MGDVSVRLKTWPPQHEDRQKYIFSLKILRISLKKKKGCFAFLKNPRRTLITCRMTPEHGNLFSRRISSFHHEDECEIRRSRNMS